VLFRSAVHVEEAHAGFAAVFLERVKLKPGVGVKDGQCAVGGGDGMIHHREGEIGAANLAPFGAEAGECLRRRAFVDEMPVNIDERRLSRLFVNYVRVPDLLVESFLWHGFTVRF